MAARRPDNGRVSGGLGGADHKDAYRPPAHSHPSRRNEHENPTSPRESYHRLKARCPTVTTSYGIFAPMDHAGLKDVIICAWTHPADRIAELMPRNGKLPPDPSNTS